MIPHHPDWPGGFKLNKDFMWGSATSAHQVEGNCTNNNWFAFESAVDKGGKPRILNGQCAGLACDQWNRFREDIALMKSLSLNAYRFSVEWSKIEPEEGRFDEGALAHYNDLIHELHRQGIRPVVTLHHFTNPLWFERKGGFLARGSPEVFERFVRVVARRLQRVHYWCTINEPTVYAINGYFTGEFPPARSSPHEAFLVLRHMLLAHARAYHTIKDLREDAQVGPALSVFPFEAFSPWNPLEIVSSHLADRLFHREILDFLTTGRARLLTLVTDPRRPISVSGPIADFIGLNYYTRFYLRVRPWKRHPILGTAKRPEEELTDMGWEIYPEGLRAALRLISQSTDKPIIITENGIADAGDKKRGEFIADHLRVLASEVAAGTNVCGYFYWSLLDNFEWAHGYTKRFGLFHVDFNTQTRTLRRGGRTFMDMVARFSGERKRPD
jgi:beta-glucosidase